MEELNRKVAVDVGFLSRFVDHWKKENEWAFRENASSGKYLNFWTWTWLGFKIWTMDKNDIILNLDFKNVLDFKILKFGQIWPQTYVHFVCID